MQKSQAELIRLLSSKQLKQQIWLSQLFLGLIAVVLASILFNDWQDIVALFSWNFSDWIIFGVFSALMIISLDLLLMKIFPKNWWDDGGINQKIFQEGSYIGIILLCFFIASVEEFLFRGVIQTNFGILIASILFAVVHIRYLSKVVLFIAIIGLSFWIGLAYYWTSNLSVVITLHFLVDVILALLIRSGRFRHAS
ncbi:CPBP family intramembrane glutamic endopeptidase [Gracilibacillus thailandensis]|uniref:CPBP family intramembrane metalloprotease n=1 Tax=Gracilibacillus thailandensis TaxID=563735 RepID=A0A6N7R3W0_9BACI|nr:CPBP family intramembrane glutamic endopeptidase [Gracilibacillus thailandensis]MRI67905.1 CPBP family intramembrane metalloprotease [Gracilibacillus thailandensis]